MFNTRFDDVLVFLFLLSGSLFTSAGGDGCAGGWLGCSVFLSLASIDTWWGAVNVCLSSASLLHRPLMSRDNYKPPHAGAPGPNALAHRSDIQS